MTLKDLEEVLKKSWSKETSVDENWSADNPSLGQCAVTALVVNDYFGGKIMRCMASTGSHYYNEIDGKLIDLTASQFMGETPQYELGEERTRTYLVSNENTRERYKKLSENVRLNLSQNSEKQKRLVINSYENHEDYEIVAFSFDNKNMAGKHNFKTDVYSSFGEVPVNEEVLKLVFSYARVYTTNVELNSKIK